MNRVSSNAVDSVSLANHLFKEAEVSLRSLQFLVNFRDGYKFVACMKTESLRKNDRILSCWNLYGSLTPIANLFNSPLPPSGVMALIKPHPPIVSEKPEFATKFRLGASRHCMCQMDEPFSKASRTIDDFMYDHFESKRKRGYVFPAHGGAGIAHYQALSWLSDLSDPGGEDWMLAHTVLPKPIVVDAVSMMGQPRRRIISLHQQPPQP